MSKRGPHLYKRLALTTLSALIGLGGAAQADTHAAGPVFGGSTQTAIVCRVFNFGSTAVSITNRLIYDSTGTTVNLTLGDSCVAPLVSGGSCSYGASITNSQAYSCRVVDSLGTTPTNLSGAAETSSASGVLTVLPLTH
jgi:hypothetical protein